MTPMVRAYHIIISCYGFWLPNDPRGSWSTWVRSWELFRYGGPATKVQTHRSVAGAPHNRQLRLAMKKHLQRAPVVFTGAQARSVALGIGHAAREGGYIILACAVLKDHVHVVVARDGRLSEQIRSHLKRAASKQLREDRLHPFANDPQTDGSLPSPWSRGGWQVFLDSPEDIRRAIEYVENNPVREGLRRQRWSFVTAFEQ
jgi:REP element-mobilizing transposase RayT